MGRNCIRIQAEWSRNPIRFPRERLLKKRAVLMTAFFIISLVLLSYYAATHISNSRLLPFPQENGRG